MRDATAGERRRLPIRPSSPRLQPSIWVLLLALAVRAAWMAHFPAHPIGAVDAEGYHLLARNLLAGNGLALSWEAPFCPTALRTPLYPLFLAGTYRLLGMEPARAVLFHLLLEVLTTALILRAGKMLGGARMGLLAGTLYALNGSTQRYTGVLFAETLLLTAVAAAMGATLSALRRPTPRRSALSGVLWGLTLLIKPNLQFLAVAAGGVFLLPGVRRRKFAPALCFCLALGMTLLPWLLRNRVLFDRWLLSTVYEENLARVSAVATLAEVQAVPAEPWTPTWEALYGEIVEEAARRYAWSALPETALPCAEREQRHRDVTAIAGEIVRAHPSAWIRSHLRGVGNSLLDPGHRNWYRALTGKAWEQTGVLDNIWRRMGESLASGAVGDALHALWLERIVRAPLDAALIWWGLLLLRGALWWSALRGCWRLRRVPGAALLLGGIAAYGLLLGGPIAHDRLYLPAIPAVVMLAAAGGLHPTPRGPRQAPGAHRRPRDRTITAPRVTQEQERPPQTCARADSYWRG